MFNLNFIIMKKSEFTKTIKKTMFQVVYSSKHDTFHITCKSHYIVGGKFNSIEKIDVNDITVHIYFKGAILTLWRNVENYHITLF